jgi:hypothetical protein
MYDAHRPSDTKPKVPSLEPSGSVFGFYDRFWKCLLLHGDIKSVKFARLSAVHPSAACRCSILGMLRCFYTPASAWQPQQINTIIAPSVPPSTLPLIYIPSSFFNFLFHSYAFCIPNQNHSFSLSLSLSPISFFFLNLWTFRTKLYSDIFCLSHSTLDLVRCTLSFFDWMWNPGPSPRCQSLSRGPGHS